MKILLSNHQLIRYRGTEVFTYTLAQSLKRKGHEVVVYSAYLGKLRTLFESIQVPVVDNVKKLDHDFEIAHVNHNINAFEIREAFPSLPIILQSHGIFPTLDHPPFIDLNISRYLGVSEEVQSNLAKFGISENEVDIFRNPVDESLFTPQSRINSMPKRALVISNTIDDVTANNIRQACQNLGITCEFIGSRFKAVPNQELPSLICQNDIIFSLSRGVIESIFCGRVPFVIDFQGGDGLVTPDNFFQHIKNNFSARTFAKEFSVEELEVEIQKYNQGQGEILRNLALKEFSASSQADKILAIYLKYAGATVPSLDYEGIQVVTAFRQAIDSTRKSSAELATQRTRENMISELGGERSYFFFRKIGNLKNKLFTKDTNKWPK
jgi:hypothetical protein